ncbi:hypothetical protein Micbo1qcDRAFT_159968, partial [Microdochium bolleyi]
MCMCVCVCVTQSWPCKQRGCHYSSSRLSYRPAAIASSRAELLHECIGCLRLRGSLLLDTPKLTQTAYVLPFGGAPGQKFGVLLQSLPVQLVGLPVGVALLQPEEPALPTMPGIHLVCSLGLSFLPGQEIVLGRVREPLSAPLSGFEHGTLVVPGVGQREIVLESDMPRKVRRGDPCWQTSCRRRRRDVVRQDVFMLHSFLCANVGSAPNAQAALLVLDPDRHPMEGLVCRISL